MNVLSLFSGGGFLDIGFINQGFQVQEAVEINDYFVKAYNFALEKYFQNSKNKYIRSKQVVFNKIEKTIDASNHTDQVYLEDKFKGHSVGIIGGPPCQDFSVGGKQAGITGERGKLIITYLEIVKKIKPSFIFFENVSGLLNTNNHRKGFESFVTQLEYSGYIAWYGILNTLDYGFPQDRKRLVLVGFKKEIVNKLVENGYEKEFDNEILKTSSYNNYVFKWPKIKYKNPKDNNWPKKWKFENKGCEYLDKAISTCYSDLMVETAFAGLSKNTPNQTEFFNPKSDKFSRIDEGDTNRKSFKRLHRYRYSPTVAYGNNEVHLHPTLPRRLSVREGLRLQTVPDEYVLPTDIPLTHKFKLISNGVPTKKAELVAKEIKRTIDIYQSLIGSNESMI